MAGLGARTGGQSGGRWGSPPLLVQILALLIGALLVAQLVTLVLTLVLPPEPPKRYEVSDIAAALRGSATDRPLERRIVAGPPDLGARGWLVSTTATAGLARAIGVAADRVVLGFYTELPIEGAIGTPGPPPGPPPLPADARPAGAGPRAISHTAPPAVGRNAQPMLALLAPVAIADGQDRPPPPQQQQGSQFPPPGPPPVGGSAGPIGAGMPGGGFPGAGTARAGGRLGERPRWPAGGADRGFPNRDRAARLPDIDVQRSSGSAQPQGGRTDGAAVQLGRERASDPSGGTQQGVAGNRVGDTARAPADTTRLPVETARTPADAARVPAGEQAPRLPAPIREPGTAYRVPSVPVPADRGTAAQRGRGVAPLVVHAPIAAPTVAMVPARDGQGAAPATAAPSTRVPGAAAPGFATVARPLVAPSGARPVPVSRSPGGLFGLAPAPFVEGDFVAALRLADGRWAVVTPAAEGFPSAWQRRVLLWFALSLLAVAPIAWAFARRIVGPLRSFADAAERLGRDPVAAILPLDGPAEVGRAAHAFNQMQSRLRSFVDDRTAMIGAISHDLRTPLTRLRFRIEEVPEEQHAGLLGEIDEMEAMISSVIAFMRDASTRGARERRDLAELVGDVVEDAALIGDVRAVKVETAPVDIDALGMRRVLDNLLTNAIKYGGGRARVALHIENALAVADIVDDGPGIAEAELERVFEPFYRSQAARDSEREGSGLGLAVCRSIARAHGGDVRLFRSREGFTARVTLPLAYDGERQLAA